MGLGSELVDVLEVGVLNGHSEPSLPRHRDAHVPAGGRFFGNLASPREPHAERERPSSLRHEAPDLARFLVEFPAGCLSDVVGAVDRNQAFGEVVRMGLESEIRTL